MEISFPDFDKRVLEMLYQDITDISKGNDPAKSNSTK